MRRKLVGLALCLLMVFSVCLVGCGEKKEGDTTSQEASARPTVSINMWVITEEKVSPETEAMIESAFNSITEAKYTTRVDFRFYTEDEYYVELDKALDAAAEYKLSSGDDSFYSEEEVAEETAATEPKTEYNEYGQKVLVYPDIPTVGQVDILLVVGKEMHDRYVSEGKIMSLETNLNASSKVLKDYIYPSFLDCAKVNNNTYAIPNNHLVGDYTFLLVNKEMAEKYYIDTDTITSFANCAALINDIGTNETIPAVLAYADPVNIQYWLSDIPETYVATAPQLTFTVDSKDITVLGAQSEVKVAPTMVDGCLMVPAQAFAKALDASYSFDSEASVATITYGARDMVLTADSATAVVHGEDVTLAAPAYIEKLGEGEQVTDEVFMVPADFLIDNCCATATIDATTGTYTVDFNDYGDMSLLVTAYGASDSVPKLSMSSIFSNDGYVKHMTLMKKCEENGWFAADPANTEDFGVAIITGGYEVYEQYADKYEVKVLSYPTLDADTVYESMFAVSSYTANLDRCMEVITLINTDPDAKNLLQYGVEGVHFKFDDEDNFEIISDDYRMNNLYTGNVFLAYNTPDVPADIWDIQKNANLESRVSPFYTLDSVWDASDDSFYVALRALSNDYFDRMADCDTEAELSEFFANSKKELDAIPVYRSSLSRESDSTSPYALYNKWGLANKYWTAD